MRRVFIIQKYKLIRTLGQDIWGAILTKYSAPYLRTYKKHFRSVCNFLIVEYERRYLFDFKNYYKNSFRNLEFVKKNVLFKKHWGLLPSGFPINKTRSLNWFIDTDSIRGKQLVSLNSLFFQNAWLGYSTLLFLLIQLWKKHYKKKNQTKSQKSNVRHYNRQSSLSSKRKFHFLLNKNPLVRARIKRLFSGRTYSSLVEQPRRLYKKHSSYQPKPSTFSSKKDILLQYFMKKNHKKQKPKIVKRVLVTKSKYLPLFIWFNKFTILSKKSKPVPNSVFSKILSRVILSLKNKRSNSCVMTKSKIKSSFRNNWSDHDNLFYLKLPLLNLFQSNILTTTARAYLLELHSLIKGANNGSIAVQDQYKFLGSKLYFFNVYQLINTFSFKGTGNVLEGHVLTPHFLYKELFFTYHYFSRLGWLKYRLQNRKDVLLELSYSTKRTRFGNYEDGFRIPQLSTILSKSRTKKQFQLFSLYRYQSFYGAFDTVRLKKEFYANRLSTRLSSFTQFLECRLIFLLHLTNLFPSIYFIERFLTHKNLLISKAVETNPDRCLKIAETFSIPVSYYWRGLNVLLYKLIHGRLLLNTPSFIEVNYVILYLSLISLPKSNQLTHPFNALSTAFDSSLIIRKGL